MRIAGMRHVRDIPAMVEESRHAKRGNNKFAAQRTDGFDSKHEASAMGRLIIHQHARRLHRLEFQKKYTFIHNNVLIGTYTADASFEAIESFELHTLDGLLIVKPEQKIVVDAKSAETRKNRDYKMKKQLMLAFFGIEVIEI